MTAATSIAAMRAHAWSCPSILVFGCWLSSAACGGSGGGDDDVDVPGDLVVALPQAHGGALGASAAVYAEVPLRIEVSGEPDTVAVSFRNAEIAAVRDGNDWVARLPLTGAQDGDYPVVARATDGGGTSTAAATLVLRAAGMQVTEVGRDGKAGTPRLHVAGSQWFLTWTDLRDGGRKARIAEVDGAGRFVGEPRVLLTAAEDIIAARTALGGDAVGVLYQHPGGGPYKNVFAVVGRDGAPRVAPIDLDPVGMYGSFGGDVIFDGEAFVLIYRINDGAGTSHIRWLRVTAAGQVTGPVTVAAAGMENPHGGFDPITHIDVELAGNAVMVAFKRELYDASLELSIPRCEVVTVDSNGGVGELTYAATGGLDWHHDCRLLRDNRGTLLMWGAQDLTDDSTEPPTALRAATFNGAALDAARGRGALVVTAPLHRSEPALVDGVMAWLDQRSYQNLTAGRIELYAAPLARPGEGAGLAAGPPTVIGHARFIEGTAELGGVAAGSNRVMVWIDERHGGSILNPRPEVYVDTLWY